MSGWTVQSPWRRVGAVSLATWDDELDRANSPMRVETAACHAAAGEHGALALAQAWVEDQYATTGSKPEARNALNLRPGPGCMTPVVVVPGKGPFLVFADWADGVTEWRRRLFDDAETYKGGVYADCGPTITDLVNVYAPPSENDSGAYARSVARELTRLDAPLSTEGVPPMPASDLSFGNVPPPPVKVRDILAPGVRAAGDGWNAMSRDRRNFGVVYHRTVGRSIAGTGDWFKRPGSGLTHYGVGAPAPDAGPDGGIYQWVDPRSRVSPWSSGPWENPPGDGRALVAKYGVSAINGDLIAIEISGLYDDPISDTTEAAVAAISAYWADQDEVPWDGYPLNPKTGLTFTYWHSEFQAHKPCPGDVVRRQTDAIIAKTKAILERYQTGADAPATPVYVPTDPPTLDPWDGSDRILANTLLWACRREFTARRPTPVLRYADRRSGEVRAPLLVGEKFSSDYWMEAGEEPWVLTPSGARIPVKDATPTLRFELV